MDNENSNITNIEINILDNGINDEYILFQHNLLRSDLEKGLMLVKQYIIDNELMVVGGMAIDLALRVKNDNLYNEKYQIADYDIIDPNNVDHANKVGSLLCSNELKNLSIIPALHKTTVRVQMSGYTLFDATYIPQYIYNKIPHMTYDRIKFIDPIFQKIDQFTSLSFLFDLTGIQYNVQHRLKKDDQRKLLLNQYYNLEYTKDDKSISTKITNISLDLNVFNNKEFHTIKINNFINNKELDMNYINQIFSAHSTSLSDSNGTSNSAINTVMSDSKDIYKSLLTNNINLNNIYYSIDCDITYHGAVAYGLIYYLFNNMITILKKNISKDDEYNKMLDNIKIRPDVIIKDNKLEMPTYKNIPIVVINNNNHIDDIIKNITLEYKITNIKKLNNIAHKIPNHITSNVEISNNKYDLHIHDLYGKLLSCNLLNINGHLFNIANYNYLLSYFLFSYFYSDDEDTKLIYKTYYISLLNIIKCSNYLYDKYSSYLSDISFNNSWFQYSINTLGFLNISENYFYFIKNFNYLIVNNANLNDLPPKNYIGYPNCNINKLFDNTNSPYYNTFIDEIQNTNFANELNTLLNEYK